jgi:hypothetical protein
MAGFNQGLPSETHVMKERISFHRGFAENERGEFNRGAISYQLVAKRTYFPSLFHNQKS